MTPREPDRFDKAALEIWGGDFTPAGFAAALRAEAFAPLGDNHHNAAACPHCGDLLSKEKVKAESSALERAAQSFEANVASRFSGKDVADFLRFLKSAAAPAAEAPIRTVPMMPVDDAADARIDALRAAQPRETSRPIAPAAETGKAQGADLLTLLRDLFGYIEDGTLVRNTACDAQPGWAPKAMKLVMTLKRVQEAIAARAAPPEEP